MISVTDTIEDGKAWLRARLDKGERCPLCDQNAKMYRRKINASAARGLIVMYKAHAKDFGHLPSTGGLARLGGEFSRLSLWGLVEEMDSKGPHGGRAGYWRVTDLGEAFISLGTPVQKYVNIYNKKAFGFEGDLVTIKDALNDEFDYDDLMAGV